MLTEKRIGQIATIMIVKISDNIAGRLRPQNEREHIVCISATYGLAKEEAKKIFLFYASLNQNEIILGSDHKDNVTFSNLTSKKEDEALLGEISLKLLERKIFLEGMSVTSDNAKRLIIRTSALAGISILEAAEFEKYLFDHFYKSVSEEIDSLIVYETGKEICENIEKFK